MSDLYEEYGLEIESDNVETALPDPLKKPSKKKGGWMKAVIALCLGFVVGAVGVVGGVFVGLNLPAKPTIEMVGGLAGINYDEQIKNKFLSEEFENKTFLQIGEQLFSAAKDKNLAGIDKVVPYVGDYIGEMLTNMNTEFGTAMDTEIVLNTEFAQLPNYLGKTFRTTPMGNMLKATSKTETLEPILMELCYGEEGVHYELDENGEVVMKNGHTPATFETFGSNPNSLINNVSVAAVLQPKANDDMMLSMAYGREEVTFRLVKNEDGTVALDENGHPVIQMLPLYFEQAETPTLVEEGMEEETLPSFVDYTGAAVLADITKAENGFLKMERFPLFNGAGTDVYYLKQSTEDGKYYAYTAPSDDAEPALFKKTMIGNLAEDSSKMIDNLYLKDALRVNYNTSPTPHKILFSLAYGRENVDYKVVTTEVAGIVVKTIEMINGAKPRTIGDLRKRGNDLINDVLISDIMSAKPTDALSMYLLYGKKEMHYTLDEDNNVHMLQKYIAISDDFSMVYNEYGELLQKKTVVDGVEGKGYVLDTENKLFIDVNGNVYKYSEPDPTKTVKTNNGHETPDPSDDYAKVYYLTDEAGVPVEFAPHSLGELAGDDHLISNLNNRLTLSEVLGESKVSSNKFLKHVKDCTLTDLPNAILDLSVTEIFYEDIYQGDGSRGFYQNTSETPLASVDGRLIYKGDYFTIEPDGVSVRYYEPTAADLKSTWKYLLTDADATDGIQTPSDYKVATDMNKLLFNMTENVDNATLNDLSADGIVKDLQPAMLSMTLKETIGGIPMPIPAGKTTIGQLTVSEMLAYTSAMMLAAQP